MKATNILKKIYKNKIDTRVQRNNVDINFTIHNFNDISEAIKELELLDNDLKDLFSCIKSTEDESYKKRFTSLETYLIRLSKFIK